MIPKIAHFYWGGGPLSYLQYLTIASFKKHNPKWKINLWMPEDESIVLGAWDTTEHDDKYTGKDYLKDAKSLSDVRLIDFDETKSLHGVQKSDYARWKILHDYGGVWSDMDILYIRPLKELLKQDFDFTVAYYETHYLIGFMITKPKEKLFADIFEEAKKRLTKDSRDYQYLGARLLRSMFMGNLMLEMSYPDSKILYLPRDVVYPYAWTPEEVNKIFFSGKDRVKPETIGIHWFNGSPVSKKYQNDESQLDNGSVMSKYIREFKCLA